MKITQKIRFQLKLQSTLFTVLFIALIGVLAWLSTQYHFRIDLTTNQRNSLSEPSLRLLGSIQQAVNITAFISPANESKQTLDQLFARYQDAQPLIGYSSINPDLAPDKLREFNIQRDGEVVVEVAGRSENIVQVDESRITNAIARLLRQGERWIVFLEGHGERDPYGDANHDLQLFASRLSQKGFRIETLNLTQATSMPQNTDVLVIADPATAMLPGELELIQRYVADGGNLLWLSESTSSELLEPLSEDLELEFLPGIIVDPSTQLLGLNRVDFALAADYPRHPITTSIDTITLYPSAQALETLENASSWQSQPLILTHDRTWNETGALSGKISLGDNPGEQPGPLNIGISLQRSVPPGDDSEKMQRVVVVGDADFLSNQFLGNGSNLSLGLNMMNWLSHDDSLIAISPKAAGDTQLNLTPTSQMVIAIVFLLALPVSLLIAGLRIWLVRRKR